MGFLHRSLRASPSVALLVLVFAGCSGQQQRPTDPATTNGPADDAASAADTAMSATTEDASTTTTTADASTAAAEADAGTAASADAATPVYVGLRTLTLRPGARPPRGALGAHGREVWSVLLAAASASDPALQTLFAQTQSLRLASSMGEARCSPAATGNAYPENVPHGDEAMVVVVNFRSERDARAFAAALTEAPPWVGRVRVLCAD